MLVKPFVAYRPLPSALTVVETRYFPSSQSACSLFDHELGYLFWDILGGQTPGVLPFHDFLLELVFSAYFSAR